MSYRSGTISYVKVNSGSTANFCLFGFVGQDGGTDNIFLWFTTTTTEQPTAADWICRNAQVALLRDAYVNKLPVVVFMDDTTSEVTSIQLGALTGSEVL
jgi:hypothetical protein